MDNFTILLIKSNEIDTNLDKINNLILDATKQSMPISIIEYSEFKKQTESKPVPVYIMNKKNNIRAEEINNIKLMKDTYQSSGTSLGSIDVSLDAAFDPRYVILDTHYIPKAEEICGYGYVIRFIKSKVLPVSVSTILNKIAQVVSQHTECMVLNHSNELNTLIESSTLWKLGNVVKNHITKPNGGAIKETLKRFQIPLSSILENMDSNIDVLMAQKDLCEYELMLAAYKSSLEFMENEGITDSIEYYETKGQISTTEEQLNRIMKVLTIEPNVISNYIRIYDPKQMEKFKVRQVNLGTNVPAESWGILEGDK